MIDRGLSAKCARSTCGEIAVIKQGRQALCAKHYRFGQMKAKASYDGKVVPSDDELSSLAPTGWSMQCQDCKRVMNWRQSEGADTVVSLQHYRSGQIALVCLSCNSRHASMPGDDFRGMDSDHKKCPGCLKVRPRSDFYRDSNRSGPLKSKSLCRNCSNAESLAWKAKNKEAYNAYQRAWRAKKKLERAK